MTGPQYESRVFPGPGALSELLRPWPSVRRALFADGVPKSFFGHRYRADPDVTLLDRPDGRAIVRFGSSGLADAIGIDLATGHVVEQINAPGLPLPFVNTSIGQFTQTVKAVIDRFPYYGQDADDTEMQAAAADLRDIIRRIDPAAIVPDRYWSTLADDAENGDLSTGEVLAAGQ